MSTDQRRPSINRTRITKDPEVRREELLDIALELCRDNGVDALRVEQIVQAAGVAKGTFYHYFASKDAVLEALVQRFGEGLFAVLSAAADTPGRAVDRLRAAMGAAQAFKMSRNDLPLASVLMRPENLSMRHRVYQEWRTQARQVLAPVIAAGAADGSFQVSSVEGATDIVLLLWFDAGDHLWERGRAAADADEFAQIMLDGARAITEAQERVLGTAAGTYVVSITPEMVAVTKQLFYSLDRNPS